MQISDVIADMLSRIRNANNAKHETVDVPASGVKKAIADRIYQRLPDNRGRQTGYNQNNPQIRPRQRKNDPGTPQNIQTGSSHIFQLRRSSEGYERSRNRNNIHIKGNHDR